MFQALREAKMGELAAYNAWASSQGFKLYPWVQKSYFFSVASLGRYASLAKINGLMITGFITWLLSRFVCLFTLPGLERNLRIVIDWILDIPFRADIVTISPRLTDKLTRLHYESGDEIIRQGEKSDSAYLLMSGQVEVLETRDGKTRQVTILNAGELFGEIGLLQKTIRTATIRCVTHVEVIRLTHDQFLPLLAGFRELEQVIHKGVEKRLGSSDGSY